MLHCSDPSCSSIGIQIHVQGVGIGRHHGRRGRHGCILGRGAFAARGDEAFGCLHLLLQGRHGVAPLVARNRHVTLGAGLLAARERLRGDEIDVGAASRVSTHVTSLSHTPLVDTYLYCACTLRLIRSSSLNVSSLPWRTSKASHVDQKSGEVRGSQNCDACP